MNEIMEAAIKMKKEAMIDRAIINANPIQLYDKIRVLVNGKVIIDGRHRLIP